jgi:hypothetical protein
VWTAVHKGSGLTMNDPTKLTMNVDDDVIVVNIKRKGENAIRIVNLDDQIPKETGDRSARRIYWQNMISWW